MNKSLRGERGLIANGAPIGRFPVIEDGKLIGQVSRRDALKAAVALRKKMAGSRLATPTTRKDEHRSATTPGGT